MDENQNIVIKKALELGLQAYLLETKDIPVEYRVRLKCIYGCRSYGKRLTCPPYIMGVDEFRKILAEYNRALLLIKQEDMSNETDVLKAWSYFRRESFHKMLELEYLAFRQGFTYAHLLRPGACNECDTCVEKCIKPEFYRFPPEAVGINLINIMKKIGKKLVFCDPSNIKCIGILLLE